MYQTLNSFSGRALDVIRGSIEEECQHEWRLALMDVAVACRRLIMHQGCRGYRNGLADLVQNKLNVFRSVHVFGLEAMGAAIPDLEPVQRKLAFHALKATEPEATEADAKRFFRTIKAMYGG